MSSSFLLGTDAVLRAEMWRRVIRTVRMTDRMTDTSPQITKVFFPYVRICLVIRLWTPWDQHAPALLHRLIHSHRYRAKAAPLILSLEVHKRCSKISSLAVSEIFSRRRMQRIGVGSMHSKSSVNEGNVFENHVHITQQLASCAMVWKNTAFKLFSQVYNQTYQREGLHTGHEQLLDM